jgi:oxalate---CoA ligase
MQMYFDLRLGDLVEPLSSRRWDRSTTMQAVGLRARYFHDRGVAASDRVFIHFGNNLEFFVDLLAVWWLGGCAVPIDPRLTPYEVETLADAAKPRFSLWHGAIDPESAAPLIARDVVLLETSGSESPDARAELPTSRLALDDVALILFTSGTTGNPKGVVHTHRSLRARWMALRQSLDLHPFRRTACLLPTHFGHGLICNCLFPWLSGADLFVLPAFRAEIIARLGSVVDEHEITFISSVPSVWRLALKTTRPPESESLERVFCGSAPLSASLWGQIQEWTGTRDVFNTYGITETGSWVAGTTVAGFEPADGLIGEPWGAAVKILKSSSTEHPPALIEECASGETGYVWLNTPALMQGYLDRDDLTDQVVSQGWFMTGDVGLVDERGWLYLRGRDRDEINKGGMKVYPNDVDAVAERFAAVSDVCTFAIDDPLYGQNVGIAVAFDDPTETAALELQQWLHRHLARHQMPVRWYAVDEIPRTSRGKTNRDHVATMCAELQPLRLPSVDS